MSESGGAFFLPFGFTPDEETLRRMREAQDRQQMVADDYHHGVARFLDGLDEEQLTVQRALFHTIAANSEGNSRVIPAFYEGIVVGILSGKFHVCIACDNDHDKLMADQMEREQQETEDTLVASDGGDPFKPGDAVPDCPIGGTGRLSDTQLANMEKYGLDDIRDQDTNALIRFVCENCGTGYVTIEDRMLEPAGKGGCSGCRQKEMWG